MESDEWFRLVFFFQGLLVLLYRFLYGTRRFFDDRLGSRCRFDHVSNNRCRLAATNRTNRNGSGGQFGFLLQTLGFTLATTHFTWIVRRRPFSVRALTGAASTDRCGDCSNNRRWCFNDWSRLGSSNHWL